jgi:hypothetical protein
MGDAKRRKAAGMYPTSVSGTTRGRIGVFPVTGLIELGKRLPNYERRSFQGADFSLRTGNFTCFLFVDAPTAEEIENFNGGAKFTAIRDRHLLYLSASFGDLTGESTYSVHLDKGAGRFLPNLRRESEIVPPYAPWLGCALIEYSSGTVLAMRQCVPGDFMREWERAIWQQLRMPHDREAEILFGLEIQRMCPASESVAHHPKAKSSVMSAVS